MAQTQVGAGAGAPAAQNVLRERRLSVAQAPARAFAAGGGAQAEKPENDQWKEL